MNNKIRKPAVAGQFYPGNKSALLGMLDQLFASVKTETLPQNYHISGLIVPHAGYMFSGKQAAKAYQYLAGGNYELVCIVSPSHRDYFHGVSIFSGDAYETPLGLCPVHTEARSLAAEIGGLFLGEEGHRGEHALEVQLPFIKHIVGKVPILPIVMGDQRKNFINAVGQYVRALYAHYGERILFVASSDLSHFHSAADAAKIDALFTSLLDKADTQNIYKALELDEVEACGGGPILSLLEGLDARSDEIKVLGYSHSGEVLHDNESVVGYTSALIMKFPKD